MKTSWIFPGQASQKIGMGKDLHDNTEIGKKYYKTANEILDIDARVKQKVNECEKFADESPYPDKNIMYDAVYEQQDYPFLKHKPE